MNPPSTPVFILLFSFLVLVSASSADDNYVGVKVCAECHQAQTQLWQGSHHDWAMKPANAQSVLGNFDAAQFEHYGQHTRFSRSDERYFIETENAEGKSERFEVAYTFGFYPLQQYLIEFPDGRLQAFSVAWDSRPVDEGGQRWFHLYPDEAVPAGDVLHWTGPYFTWNTRCAACHSTNLQRNYSREDNRYQTQWSEINVACEACHGAGQAHVDSARARASNAAAAVLPFEPISAMGQWLHSETSSTATLKASETQKQAANEQLSMCGSCHARRALIDDLNKPGDFHQQHQLQVLDPTLYHADGQILDEVYVLGSFLQSKMHAQGVVCSNCHEPHSLKLRAQGNLVCAQCHQPQVFDTPVHHHHPEGSGSQCVNCHMPESTYMVVDPRRDHSLRIPRPDLSDQTGAPNACVQCHEDKSNRWASEALKAWLKPKGIVLPNHYGEVFAAFRAGEAGAVQKLMSLAMDPALAPLVRASALTQLPLNPQSRLLAQAKLHDPSPMVRGGALTLLEALPAAQNREDVFPLLQDPVKSVRLAAARLLAGLEGLGERDTAILNRAVEELREALLLHQDTASGQINLADLALRLNQMAVAEEAYRHALLLDRHNVGALLNLADLFRQQQKDSEGEALLRQAVALAPEMAAPEHALGLLLVRQKQYTAALNHLQKAKDLAPENTRYAYIYAVAANSLGDSAGAIDTLEAVLTRDAQHVEALRALVGIYYHQKDAQNTLKTAQKLIQLEPENASLRRLIEQIQRQ